MEQSTSLAGRQKWTVPTFGPGEQKVVAEMAQRLGVHPVVAGLLYRRGYTTAEAAGRFLCMETEMLEDPFALADVGPAVARIRQAVENGEKILIYGDYDVDGVTSVCTAYLYLRSRGAQVFYFIPSRGEDGHGVSAKWIDEFAEKGISLIVTVDTGITAGPEVEAARERGIDFVITDHHECHVDLPHAVAVVNPRREDCAYPFKELAGVGVIFKLICAYECTVTGAPLLDCVKRLSEEYGDLVALGTIADVMPVRGENRLMIAYGLHVMDVKRRVGTEALLRAIAKRNERRLDGTPQFYKRPVITSTYVGYNLAPRINAAGRILTASVATQLFLSEDEGEAEKLAEMLCTANRQRQEEENRIVSEAYEQIEDAHPDLERDPFVVLASDFWHPGVIGIVASRITEKYGVPCVLVSFDGCDPDAHSDEDMGKGSGRSIRGINLVDALCTCADFLPKFGGHELAAGFSVRRGDFSLLRERLCDFARRELAEHPVDLSLETDGELCLSDISMALARDIQKLEPYGAGNPVPLFVLRNVKIKEVVPVSAGKHSKLMVGDDRLSLSAMYFSHSPGALGVQRGDFADLLFSVDINDFNGRKTVQLIVRDMRKAEAQDLAEAAFRRRFDEIWHGARFDPVEDVIPVREDFAAVYCYLRHASQLGITFVSHHNLLINVAGTYGGHINYIKLRFIIRILQEMNVLGIEEEPPECYSFQLRFSDTKADLEKSNILRKLRSQQN